MRRRIVTVIMMCTLCMTMFEGCGKDAKSSEKQSNDDYSYESSDIIEGLKMKYAGEANYEYAQPMYNLEKNHIFEYKNVPQKFFENEEYECFEVYSDSNFQQRVDTMVEFDWDNNSVKIYPRLVFSYDEPEGSLVDDGTWGRKSKFWLVQYVDTKTGDVLDKPIVTVFTIAQDLNTPTLTQSIAEDGSYRLSWTEVEGADYYEVYEYSNETEYSDLQATTKNTSCEYGELADAKWSNNRFKETYKDTEIDVNEKFVMNNTMQYLYSYFVVAKTNDGKYSGMSNICNVTDFANQIPYTVSWDFQKDYEGDSILACPAYVDMEMIDGSIGKYLIEYQGAEVTLFADGRIAIKAKIKNLPITMPYIYLKGISFEEFMSSTEELKARQAQIASKSVTSGTDIDIPYVPDNDFNLPKEDEKETPEETTTVPEEETKDNQGDKNKDLPNIDISDEVAATIYGNTALSEWIAMNLLSHNETIVLDEFPESSDTDYLMDAMMEAYTQNPLSGIVKNANYDYKTNSILVKYVMSKEETVKMQEQCLDKADEIVNDIIKEGMSDYEKEEAINRYICENAEYNYEIFDYISDEGTIANEAVVKYKSSFTPYGVLVENMGVCESYSEAFLVLAQKADLKAVIVTGRKEGIKHEWNRVNIDSQWYTLDVTNNDCDYLPNCFFNLPDDVAENILQQDKNSFIDSYFQNYTASGMENEYYVKNGLYIDNENEAVSKLAEQLSDNNMAAVRVSENIDESKINKIVQQVADNTNIESGKYYFCTGVISIIKQ